MYLCCSLCSISWNTQSWGHLLLGKISPLFHLHKAHGTSTCFWLFLLGYSTTAKQPPCLICFMVHSFSFSLHEVLLTAKKKGKKRRRRKLYRGIKVTEKKLLWPSKTLSFLFQTTGSVMTPLLNSVKLISFGAPNFCYLKPFLPLIKLIAAAVPATNITSY